MGREARRVPAHWRHPKTETAHGEHFKPLYQPAKPVIELQREWFQGAELWAAGEHPAIAEYDLDLVKYPNYEHWDSPCPDATDYMPYWPPDERTHWQMYEDTSEGTPISPVMESPEALARWLADNGASAFADRRATYEQWLSTIKRGWAASMVNKGDGRGLVSGVEGFHQDGGSDG